uniref:Nephrocystin 3-like N-terminal domain-containing protein n=1 Tax=Moniliophthora roreri TaxID=221103 RepID=A0A0W0FM54_MONRR
MAFNGSDVQVLGDTNNTVGRDQYVYNLSVSDSKTTLELLAQKAAHNACYNSEQRFPPPNCHPGTRAKILEELCHWIEDDSKSTRVFWIHGSAGVGKSAIAQNIAEKYAGTRLAAAFFFSRNDSTRDSLTPFVASVAYQFCKPDSRLRLALGPMIIEAIHSEPSIFQNSCEDLPRQDERYESERLVAMVQKATAIQHSPIPWIILIFSRPEPQIRDAFDHEGFDRTLRLLAITPSDEARQDIRRYLVDQFTLLQKKYRSLRHEDTSWPGNRVIDQLVDRADGQFIFPVTVIKYIDTRDERPQDRLDTILRIYIERDSDSPYSDLDLLYRQILSTCQRWEKVRPVLRLLVTHHNELGREVARGPWSIHWRSPTMIERLLNLKKGELATILSRLHSVLQIPEDDDSDIHIAHASFTEFISDSNRSAEYHILKMSEQEYCDCIATLLLRTLSTLTPHYPLFHPESTFTTRFSLWRDMLWNHQSELMEYSCLEWDRYCTLVDSPSSYLLAQLSEFQPHCVLAAMNTYYSYFPNLSFKERVIEWAKTFGQSTETFIKMCEPCSQGYRIAFPPAIPRHEILWWTFQLEKSFCDENPIDDFQEGLLRQIYSEEYRPPAHSRVFMVLPADTDSRMGLPEDWLFVHATKTNGEVFERVTGALRTNEKYQRLFLADIRLDTRETVSHPVIKEDDLIHLKRLLKERRELLDDLLDERSFYSFPDSSSGYEPSNMSEHASKSFCEHQHPDEAGDEEQPSDSPAGYDEVTHRKAISLYSLRPYIHDITVSAQQQTPAIPKLRRLMHFIFRPCGGRTLEDDSAGANSVTGLSQESAPGTMSKRN